MLAAYDPTVSKDRKQRDYSNMFGRRCKGIKWDHS